MKNDIKQTSVLLLTQKDPWFIPIGGQAAFAKQLLTVFGGTLAVSSFCEDQTIPTGKWVQRSFFNNTIWFLSLGKQKSIKHKKPFMPDRIKTYFYAKKFMSIIREIKFKGLLIDCPELLFAASTFKWGSVCYSFAGVNNPVANSRYIWARWLGGQFEKYFIDCLIKVNPEVMIAAADLEAINEFFVRTGNRLNRSRFYQFPTRVDTEVFYPIKMRDARRMLNLPQEAKIFTTTGRLNWVKGWNFLLESIVLVKQKYPLVILIFVGDGEDRTEIEKYARMKGIHENIRITGFISQLNVARFMNAADVCLVGSHHEGWSLAMCEMIACGKVVVSTDVSGAHDMIKDGKNGYIVTKRDPKEYAQKIFQALKLTQPSEYSIKIAQEYSIENLHHSLTRLWPPLQ
jgi:glycosyltransferase involved in cell wall biosynthesis